MAWFRAPFERNIGDASDVRLLPPDHLRTQPLPVPQAVGPARVDASGWRRVLAVRLDNMGDVVLAGPALRAIKAAAPAARLTLLASPAGAQAAALLPWVDEVIVHRASWQ